MKSIGVPVRSRRRCMPVHRALYYTRKMAMPAATWIAAHENGNAIVFLNGGFVCHQPAPPYRKSRGLVLLDLLDSANPGTSFSLWNLQQIEPFTAVIWNKEQLVECRWDGAKKHMTELNDSEPHIWSSATLYDEAVTAKRKSWFIEWLQQHAAPAAGDLLHFHQFTGDGDAHNDLLMNRNGQVFTVSVTQLVITGEQTHMHYLDLKHNKIFTQQLTVEKSMASRE